MARLVPSLFSVLFFLTLLTSAHAQTGSWQEITISGRVPHIYDMEMADENFGIMLTEPDIANDYSGVLFTTTGWSTWVPVAVDSPIFVPSLPDWARFRAVDVLSSNMAVIVGDSALAYKTFDGGRTWFELTVDWDTQQYMSPPTFHDVEFIHEGEGMIVGGDGFEAMQYGGEMHTAQVFYTTSGGTTWSQLDVPPQFILAGMGALLTVAQAGGKYILGGEFGLLFEYDGTGSFTPIYPVSVSAMSNIFFTDISMPTATDVYIVGQNSASQIPVAFKSIFNGTRYVNMVPGSLPFGVDGMWQVDFLTPNRGMIGAGMHYIGVTADGGYNVTPHKVGFNPPRTPMTALQMVNAQSGFACGGDTTSNVGWVIKFFGVPPEADISTTDTEITFPTIACERSVEERMWLRSSGSGNLQVTKNDITFSPPEYEIVNDNIFPLNMKPGLDVELIVRWTPRPGFAGTQVGTMSISNNDPDNNPWRVRLEGTRNHGTLDFLSEMLLSYGTCLGDTLEYQIPVMATGNRDPSFIGMEFVSGDDDFDLVEPAPGTLVQGAETFKFLFAPQDSALRRGVYRFIHGNPSCPDTTNVALSGVGNLSVIAASSDTIDFGEICLGEVKDTTITLQNLGNTFASISNLERSSGDAGFSTPVYGLVLRQDSSKTYTLRFNPFSAGEFEGTYAIRYGPCQDSLMLYFKGKALETEVEFDPKSPVRIGPIFANRTAGQTITITNSGDTPARLTKLRFSKLLPPLQIVNRPALPLTLLPNQSTSVTLRFAPVDIGEYNTSIIVEWDARCPDSAEVEINAICVPNPQIDAPASADLGTQHCPAPLRDTVIIRNKGNGPLVFYSVSVSGPDRAHFRVISPVIDDTVAPESDFPMIVEYDRDTEGRSHAIVRLTHNDKDAGLTDIDVTANRTIAEYIVEGDSTTAFFTRLFVSEDRSFVIRNNSNEDVTITDLAVVRDASVFTVQPLQPLPVLLKPNQTLGFDVTFTPNARGPFRGIVQIISDPCDLPYALGLDGTGDTDGLSPDRGDITFALDPCTFAPACEPIILKNQGLEPVEVTGLTITPGGTVFALDPPVVTPFSMNPNEERTIRVCASPTLLGNENASLVITSDDPAYPSLSVALHASRDSVGFALSTQDIDFGRLAECEDAERQNVIVTNTGTGVETLDISFANGAAFSATATGSITIPPGKNSGFFVEFTRPGYGVFDDVLILTSQTCGTEYRITLHAEAVEQIYTAAPDPLTFPTVNVGGASTRSFSLQNAGGLDAVIASVDITPSGTFALQPGWPSKIDAGSGGSFDIRFNPQSEGTFTATACVIISAPCPDTVCVELSGEGVQGTLEVQPPLLAFGTRAQCQELTLYDTLSNTGSGPITLLSADITGTNAAAFTNLTPITNDETIPAGNSRIFEIRFNPALVAGDGPVTAALQINTDDAVLPTFDIPLEATRVTLLADDGGSIDFGPVEAGNPESQTVTLRNDGSVPLCYTTSTVPAGITFTPSLPLCIDPGMTADLTVTYTASAPGSFRDNLALYVDSPCVDSTLFSLRAEAQEGTLTQPDTLNLGTIAWCDAQSIDFSIVSSYLQDIMIESMSMEGPDAVYFGITYPDPASLPSILAAGSSQDVTIQFTPDEQTRQFTATFVSTFTAFGTSIERRTVIFADVAVPGLIAGSATFPTTVIGQSGGTQTIQVENTSTIPVAVSSITASLPDFVINSMTPAPPVTLQPGQSIDVEVEFLPTTAGTLVADLLVSSDAPCPFSIAGTLEGEAIPQPIVDVTLSVADMQAEVDQMIDIAVLVDQDLGPAEVTEWSGSLSFNRTMLYPTEVISDATLSSAMTVDMQYDNASGTVTLAGSGARVGTGDVVLVIVRCLVLVGNDVSTPITISEDFGFGDGYARVVSREDGRFDLVNYCLPGDRLVGERPGFVLDQNRPNPVSQGTRAVTTISYALPQETAVTLDLYDMIGRHVRRIDDGVRPAGLHTVNLSVSDLQPGTYVYVLRSAEQAAVRRMVIVR